MDLLGLEDGRARPMAYDAVVRKDFKLLEMNDELLEDILHDRCLTSQTCT